MQGSQQDHSRRSGSSSCTSSNDRPNQKCQSYCGYRSAAQDFAMTFERAKVETLESSRREDTKQHVCCNRAYGKYQGHDDDQSYAVFPRCKERRNSFHHRRRTHNQQQCCSASSMIGCDCVDSYTVLIFMMRSVGVPVMRMRLMAMLLAP